MEIGSSTSASLASAQQTGQTSQAQTSVLKKQLNQQEEVATQLIQSAAPPANDMGQKLNVFA